MMVAQLSWKAIVLDCYCPFPQLAGGGMDIEDFSLSYTLPQLCVASHADLSRSETAHPPKASHFENNIRLSACLLLI